MDSNKTSIDLDLATLEDIAIELENREMLNAVYYEPKRGLLIGKYVPPSMLASIGCALNMDAKSKGYRPEEDES